MVGRVLGGIATSLLFSAFESWLVAEHNKVGQPLTPFAIGSKFFFCSSSPQHVLCVQRGFEQQWLSVTFSKAIFLGNGLVAIIAGLFGNYLVDSLALGPVAPFDAAACFLAIGMAVIISSWSENYGDPSENKDLITQFKNAASAIASGESLTTWPWFLTYDFASSFIPLTTLLSNQMRRSYCLVLYSLCLKGPCTPLCFSGLLL